MSRFDESEWQQNPDGSVSPRGDAPVDMGEISKSTYFKRSGETVQQALNRMPTGESANLVIPPGPAIDEDGIDLPSGTVLTIVNRTIKQTTAGNNILNVDDESHVTIRGVGDATLDGNGVGTVGNSGNRGIRATYSGTSDQTANLRVENLTVNDTAGPGIAASGPSGGYYATGVRIRDVTIRNARQRGLNLYYVSDFTVQDTRFESGSVENILTAQSKDGSIENITIDGGGIAIDVGDGSRDVGVRDVVAKTDSQGYQIQAEKGSKRVTFERCYSIDAPTGAFGTAWDSVGPDNPEDITFKDCVAINAGDIAFLAEGKSDADRAKNIRFENCRIINGSSYGFRGLNVDGLVLEDCRVVGGGYNRSGAVISNVSELSVRGGLYAEQSNSGIKLGSCETAEVAGAKVQNNDQKGGGVAGIQVADSEAVSIHDCDLRDTQSTATQEYGVESIGSSDWNRVHDCDTRGVVNATPVTLVGANSVKHNNF